MTDLLRAAQALNALDPRDTYCSRALAKPLAEYLAAVDADDIDEMYRTQCLLVATILARIGNVPHPIKRGDCPSVSPRAARREWGASKPAPPLPTHEFVGRLNWMGQPALAFREFCEICDKHRDHPIHKGAP